MEKHQPATRHEPISRELTQLIFRKDRPMGGRCYGCACEIKLYTFSIGRCWQCPNCLKSRIDGVLADGAPLAGELAAIYGRVLQDVASQGSARRTRRLLQREARDSE
ncbi:MAG: hypothetical protein ACODAA_00540 [Gemmatimonadota bacterium]